MERQDDYNRLRLQRLQKMRLSRDLSLNQRQEYRGNSYGAVIDDCPSKGYDIISNHMILQKNRAISNLLLSIIVAKQRSN